MSKIWIGSPSDVKQGEAATPALAQVNDSQYWDEETGIIEVDQERWERAQKFERDGWLKHWRTATADRNEQHRAGFDDYRVLPTYLGNVLEIGCGPFTQLKTIAEGREIDKVTLLDPLLEQYKQLPHCSYKNDRFLDQYDTTLICNRAEALHGVEQFDTAICINVLEHVQDVKKILRKLHRSLKVGGIVIFGERCYDGLDISNVYDVGHPIRPKLKVFLDWQDQFEPLFRKIPMMTDPKRDILNQEHYFIGEKL